MHPLVTLSLLLGLALQITWVILAFRGLGALERISKTCQQHRDAIRIIADAVSARAPFDPISVEIVDEAEKGEMDTY
jgi:hypothetical protein